MTGILVSGVDPKGPALYVETDRGTFPVAITTPAEMEFLNTWVGKRVQCTPKVFGTRTNPDTHKIECILFATDVRGDYAN